MFCWGDDDKRAGRPDRVDPLRRPVGHLHACRVGEANGQLAEAADLFKKAAAEAAGKPFPLQAALFREAEVLTDLALVEPDRAKEAKDRLTRFVQAYPNGRHIAAARGCLARLQLNAGDFKGAEATIAELAKIPKAGERAAVLKTKILARQGKHAEAIAELDRLIASYPKGSERQRDAMLAKAESLAGRQTVQGSRNTRQAGYSSQPTRRCGRSGTRV